MKFYAILCCLTAAALFLTPAITLALPEKAENAEEKQTAEETVTVFLTDKTASVTLPMEEYLVGAVAAEMPATYHPQALAAQAVACRTYALYRREQERVAPNDDLQGADLSDQPQKHQGYLSEDDRKAKWGDSFETYEKKVRDAVKSTGSTVMTYEGKPICAAFFAISAGQTESAQTVFGDDLPYLKGVSSSADILSPMCAQTVVFSQQEFADAAKKLEIELQDDPDEWLGEQKTTDSGFVEEITVGRKEVSGTAFREAFGLRSAVFTLTQTESGFRIQTKGHGHLVGLSQYGANAMAEDGADYRTILKHYYTGVTLSDG